VLVPPDAAGVILGASDDGIALVIEGAGKDLVRMPLQLLQKLSSFAVPESGDLVEAGSEDLGALGVEGDLGDVLVVA
jgi:hypothetical protein